MTEEQKQRIAKSAASQWCHCFKCDGIIRESLSKCDKEKGITCCTYRDGYRTALLALDTAETIRPQD